LPRRLNGIHSPPHLVPEHRRHLPFIQQARPRPSQHQGRIHRQRLPGGEVYIQEHRGGGQLLGQAGLAAGFGPSITTTPAAPRQARNSASAMRGR
jgi:hypothetical protein